MYGTLRGALAGRKIEYDRESYRATVEWRIAGIGKTIHIKSIHVHYELAVPGAASEPTDRALVAQPTMLSPPPDPAERHQDQLVGHVTGGQPSSLTQGTRIRW